MLSKITHLLVKIRNLINKKKRIVNPKLYMTLLVKDEVDVIESNIIFHKNMGVDGFIVTDNASTDGTSTILEKYKEMGWIKELILEPSADYNQVQWVDRMIFIAKEKYGADWVINSDADEFWCCKTGNLKNIVESSNANVINVDIFNVYPENEATFFENDKLITNAQAIPQQLLNKLSSYSLYTDQIGKVIHRTQGYVKINMGNHNVKMKRKSISKASDVLIYHYNLRGLEHFKRKMIGGGASVNSSKLLSKNAALHWRHFYDLFVHQKIPHEDEYKNVIGAKYYNELELLNVFKKGNIVKDFFKSEHDDKRNY